MRYWDLGDWLLVLLVVVVIGGLVSLVTVAARSENAANSQCNAFAESVGYPGGGVVAGEYCLVVLPEGNARVKKF